MLICGGGQGAGARENRGRDGYGRGEKKGGRDAGEKFNKASFRYLLLLTSRLRNEPITTFLDFHLTFSKASSKFFYARKVKKRKFVLGIKLETFPSRLRHRT